MKLPTHYLLVLFVLALPDFLMAQDGASLAWPADDFALIKERVVSELLKTEVDPERVENIMERMGPDGSFPEIDYADLSRTAGFPHRNHTYDLVYLARAHEKTSSPFFESDSVKQHVIQGLQFWVDNDFVGDNWHNNQISTPTNLVNLMLIMGDELPEDLVNRAQPIIGRAHMNASGARPSGDRIVIAGILAKNLLFLGDKERFDDIIELIEGELKFSTGQRGIQADYSFHHRHDRVNNTTSYGYTKYANAFGEWSYYVAGTQYAFSREKINMLVDYYLEGIFKQQVYGIYPDVSVKNRSISHRQSAFEPRGTEEIERLLVSTDYRKDELEEIMRLRKGEAEPSDSFAKFFWQTEHFVFQRPGFYTTVRMYSTRNRNMEVPYNGPGKTTHHRADGTNYLMLKGDEYFNIWAVYDWQKISGTTIMQKPALPGPEDIQKDGFRDFVGAVTDGLYGAVAFDFKSPHDMLEAKKSWFFFDEEYVCLGTDIDSDPNLPVATTLNQAHLRSDVFVKQGDAEHTLPKGDHYLENIKWVHHDRVGYIFPEETGVSLSNQTEHGRWSDITDQKNISEELVSQDVFTLWFDHGESPDDASYQYIVVPDTELYDFRSAEGDNRGIEILSQNSRVHAVMSHKQNICQAAFYQSGTIDISNGLSLELASQGMAMLKLEDGAISEITVSDPSRKLGRMLLRVTGVYETSEPGARVIPDPETGESLLIVDLPQGDYAGSSVTLPIRQL